MYAHTTENGERFHKVLIVLSERQVVELVNELNNADYLTGRIFDGHTKNGLVLEAGAIVNTLIETYIFIGIRDVNSLRDSEYVENATGIIWIAYLASGCYVASDTAVDRESTFERTGIKWEGYLLFCW